MAASNATAEKLRSLKKRDLVRFLETDPRVRAWLAGGDPLAEAAGALISTKDAAELLGVERPRIWRWEKAGRLERVSTTRATPLFFRHEVEQLKRELDAERERRAEAVEA
jgi:predicted DNA-binding transcriptional regulator AlpA